MSGSFSVDKGSQGSRFEPLDATRRLSQRLSGSFGRVVDLVVGGDTASAKMQAVSKQPPAVAKKSITEGRIFSKFSNPSATLKGVFTNMLRRSDSAQTVSAPIVEPQHLENPVPRIIESLTEVMTGYENEEMRRICDTHKEDLANLTPLEKLTILTFLFDNPELLAHSAASELLQAVAGHNVEDIGEEIESLKNMANPDKALSKEELTVKTKQLLATKANPGSALEKAIGPKAAGLAALLADIRERPSEAKFQKLHEMLKDAMMGEGSDSQEIQDLRDAYVVLLSRAIGGPTAAKYVAFECKAEAGKIASGEKAIDTRFRQGSVAGTLYRGIMKSEFPALRANSSLMKTCIQIAKSSAKPEKRCKDVLDKVETAFQNEMPAHLRILNTMLVDSFKDMFKAQWPKKNAAEETEKQLISMTFLRLIGPTMLSDKDDRLTETVKSLQSAATYSKGIREDAVAATLVDRFREFAQFLTGNV
jgi:hypothetical protein